MKRIRAKHLRKGDLIYYQDSYFEVVTDGHINPPSIDNYFPYVLIRCFMCPSNTIGIAIGTCKHITIHEYVLLLNRSGFGGVVSIAYSALKNWIATVRFLVFRLR